MSAYRCDGLIWKEQFQNPLLRDLFMCHVITQTNFICWDVAWRQAERKCDGEIEMLTQKGSRENLRYIIKLLSWTSSIVPVQSRCFTPSSSQLNSLFLLILFLKEEGCMPGGGGVLPEKMGRGVRPASQNPYPIYDQNLRFCLPYLWPDQKFDTLFMTWLLDH